MARCQARDVKRCFDDFQGGEHGWRRPTKIHLVWMMGLEENDGEDKEGR